MSKNLEYNIFHTPGETEILDLPMGEFIACGFPLAKDNSGEVKYLIEVLPLLLDKEENIYLTEIKQILSTIQPEELRGLLGSVETQKEFDARIMANNFSITEFNTSLCTSTEKDEIYCRYASLLYDLTHGRDKKEVVPFVYVLGMEEEEVVTKLIEPSRGMVMPLTNKGEDNEFDIYYVGYTACLHEISRSLLTRLFLNKAEVDYFEKLAPLSSVVSVMSELINKPKGV